jgi:hypothetical protein
VTGARRGGGGGTHEAWAKEGGMGGRSTTALEPATRTGAGKERREGREVRGWVSRMGGKVPFVWKEYNHPVSRIVR